MNPSIRSRLFHCTLESNSPLHECREIYKYTINSNSSKLQLRAKGGGVVPHTLFEILRKLQLLLIPKGTSVSQHEVDHLNGQTYLIVLKVQ